MAHAVETMMSVKKLPWHGLGVILNDAPTSAEAIVQSGLNWTVRKVPLFGRTEDGEDCFIEDKYAIIRSSDNKALGVVGKVYKIIQNHEAFSFVDSLISSGDVRYETAGSLMGGRKVWLLARLQQSDIILSSDDKVETFLLFSSTHDGSGAIDVRLVTTRVVCANTLAIALREGLPSYRIAHRGNLEGKLALAREVLGLAQKRVESLAETFEMLANTPISEEVFGDILDGILIGTEKEVLSNRARGIKANILRAFNYSPGSNLSTAQGTAWGALNAVTHYVSHNRSTRTADGQGGDRKFESVLFGTGNEFSTTILDQMIAHATKGN